MQTTNNETGKGNAPCGKLVVVKHAAPSYWASYLINGDASGMEDSEQAECDAWIKAEGLPGPVNCEPAGFGSFYFRIQGKTLGCDLETYSFLVPGVVELATFGREFIGCVIDRSYGGDISLETIEFAQSYGFELGEELPEEESDDYGQIVSEVGDDAVNWLNEQDTLSYCYFSFDDNSLFFGPCIDGVMESVDFVSSKDGGEYPGDDFSGEWLHVNERGNATLYVRTNGEDKEIWGVV